VFFSQQQQMMPAWFPWIFVGGLIFILLSFIGAKYKDKEYKNIQFLQDFISGAIMIGFTGVLVPDLFPVLEIPSLPSFPSMPSLSTEGGGDMELQVGPPRLFGR
jgi:hypothetical protein